MNKNREKLFLAVLFVFCLFLRLIFITQKNLWFDEIFSWHLSQGSFLDITWGTSADIHPPLYYYLLKIWMSVLGDSVFSLRFLSAFISSSAIFLIYPVSRKILSENESLIVLILYSLSPLNLYYSQEARMAALNLLLNTASFYFFIKLLEFRGGFTSFLKNINVWAYLVLTTMALYTHYFSFTFLAGEVLYLLFNIKHLTRRFHHFLFVYILIFAGYLFWLPIMIKHMTAGQPWRTPQSILSLFEQFFYFWKDISLGLYHFYADYRFTTVFNVTIILLYSISILGLMYLIFKRIKETNVFPDYFKLIITVTFIPLIIASVIFMRERIEFFRYLSFILPFILICGMIGTKSLNKYAKIAIVVLFAAVNIYGDALYYSFEFKNNDYRQVIKTLESKHQDNEKIFVYPHYYGWIIDYYKKEDDLKIPKPVDTRYGWNQMQDSIHTQKPAKFWLVLDYGAQDTATFKDKLNILEYDYNISFRDSFPTVPFLVKVYRFEKKN